MQKLFTILPLLLLALSKGPYLFGQTTVSGPTCVIPGTVYQYLISGKWDSASTMQVCLQGAVIAQLNGSCTGQTTPLSAILVQWNASATSGSLNLSSTSGNTTLAVTVTRPLQAGTISAISRLQQIGFNKAPTVIHCGADSGGSCHPVYVHQWQQSFDKVNWIDIPQASAQDLQVLPLLKLTRFFRRKTVETGSGSIAYSDAAEVRVSAPTDGSISLTNP